jgi:hypothetical protein
LNFDDPSGLVKLPRSRTGTRPCTASEEAECIKMCGSKGMQSCRISQTFRMVRWKDGKGLYKWVDGPMSCSCNDPGCEPVPVPVPKPAPTRDKNKNKKPFGLEPGTLVPRPVQQEMMRNAAVAGTLTLMLMMMILVLAF